MSDKDQQFDDKDKELIRKLPTYSPPPTPYDKATEKPLAPYDKPKD